MNRTPFDLPEAESEIIAGYHTEYSGMRFGLFFLAEYLSVFAVSCLGTAVFLGGGTLPWPFTGEPVATLGGGETLASMILLNLPLIGIFMAKVSAYKNIKRSVLFVSFQQTFSLFKRTVTRLKTPLPESLSWQSPSRKLLVLL